MLPETRPAIAGKFWGLGSCRRGCRRAFQERNRRLVADRAVGSDLVIVSTPSLHFFARVVKRHEPVGVQALRPELAVEAFDEGVIRRLAFRVRLLAKIKNTKYIR